MNQAALHRMLSEKAKPKDPAVLFDLRMATNLTLIKDLFLTLYPKGKETGHFKKLLKTLRKLHKSRPDELKAQDIKRLHSGNWYQSEQLVGMQLYVDRFAKDLKTLEGKLGYFEALGVNFVHLMPLTKRPQGENDGGYAVNDYVGIDKRFGTKKDLLKLSSTLREKNMYVMLDFVVNHTSDEFPWAEKAKSGDRKYQEFYYTYAERDIPDLFEQTLPEVFPETSPGNFTFIPEMQRWVMTVFNSYQWDLNYTNPEVFLAMLENLVKLVNLGVDVVRFDALAFLWKKIGTISQNLPEAHTLISLFRMCLQVVAPGSILLAEAIVSPTDILKYFGEGLRKGNECEIAYNASLMAILWNSIATKKAALLHKSLTNVASKPEDCTWVNYIRCHDDIGLGLDDRFITELGWNPQGHRKFLLDYYCQQLNWSPAKGLPFMYNPKTGDGRITGSAASLLGLERGLEGNDQEMVQKAIDKIILLHSIVLSFGGIPMIYAGDEIGTLNDYTFLNETDKKEDSRWVNRPKQDWALVKKLDDMQHPQSVIYNRIKSLIALRKRLPVLADRSNPLIHHCGNEHLFVFERKGNEKSLLIICNFDESEQVFDSGFLERLGYLKDQSFYEIIGGAHIRLNSGFISIAPYGMLWIQRP